MAPSLQEGTTAPSRLTALMQPLPEGVTEEQMRALSIPRAEVIALGAQAPLALEMLEASQTPGHVSTSEKRKLRELLQHPLPLSYRRRLVDSRFRDFLLEHATPEGWLDTALFDFCLASPSRVSDVAKNPRLSADQVHRLEDWQMEWMGPRAEEFCALEFGEHINITCTLIYAVQAGHPLREETRQQLYEWALLRSEEEERARDRARAHNHRAQNRHPGVMVVSGKGEIPVPLGVVTERASTATSILMTDRRTPPEWLVEVYRVQAGTSNVGGMDDQMMRHPALKLEHYLALAHPSESNLALLVREDTKHQLLRELGFGRNVRQCLGRVSREVLQQLRNQALRNRSRCRAWEMRALDSFAWPSVIIRPAPFSSASARPHTACRRVFARIACSSFAGKSSSHACT